MILVNVTKNKVKIANDYVVNRGEYKANKVQFGFSDDYNGLVKKVIFKDKNNTIEQAIINDECDIPYEVLNSERIELRVYGYEVENNDLKLRYSPEYTQIITRAGSYITPTGQGEEITPTQFEQYEQALNDGLEEVANVDIDATKVEHTTTVTITNRNAVTKEVEILDGEKGQDGKDGKDGEDYVITQEDYQEIANVVRSQIDIPTKTSDLQNDSGYINNNVDDLTNYYKKADTYSKTEIDTKISSVYKYKGSVATYSDLPSTDLTVGDVYNVESDGSNYAWNGTQWDKLGGDIDLSNYYNKTQTDSLLAGKQNIIDTNHKLASNLVDDSDSVNKFTTTAEKTTWNAKYDKPGTGIPKTDLASDVQTSLGKADTAIQTHQDISGKEDKSNKVTSLSSSSTNTQYPSAKLVYDELASRDAEIDLVEDRMDVVEEIMPTISATGTEITLQNTKKAGMKLALGGNTEQATAILPSGYTQVDYIESSGTEYIDTGYKPNQNTRIETELFFNENYNNRHILLYGTRGNGDINSLMLWDMYTNKYLQYTFGSNIKLSSAMLISNSFNKIEHDVTGLKLNGNTIVSNTNPNPSTWEAVYNLLIFTGRNTSGDVDARMAAEKIKYFKIYNNNTLVREFIPCYRNSDSVVGLYDLVNGVFYMNQGTGAFTYGSVVSIPNPDYPQDIHTVTGNNTVLVEGKNRLPYPYTETTKTDKGVTFTVYSDGSILVNGTATGGNASLKLFGNSPMSSNLEFPAKYLSGGTSQVRLRAMNNTNENYTVLGTDTGDGAEINTTTYSKGYIELVVNNGTAVSNQTIKPMLLNNLSDRTFEPYNGTSYPVNLGTIELCKIGDYQDRIFKAVDGDIYYDTLTAAQKAGLTYGKWYKHSEIGKITITGNDITAVNSSATNTTRGKTNNNFVNADVEGQGYCNYFTLISNWNTDTVGIYFSKNNGDVWFRANKATIGTTLGEVQTWVNSHNIILYYPLATPTNTEITDTALISQLEAIYLAKSAEGITTITQTNADLGFILTAIAFENIDMEGYVRDTDYASENKAGVIKATGTLKVSDTGVLYADTLTYAQYQTKSNGNIIGKGTLENFIAGRFVTLTQAQYDQITPDANTFYFITN